MGDLNDYTSGVRDIEGGSGEGHVVMLGKFLFFPQET